MLRGGIDVQLYSIFNLGARCGWVVNATPRPLYHQGKTRSPFYRRLRVLQVRSGRVRKILALLGLDPRSVQPVARFI